MAVESAADRAVFLDADEFGVEATYTANAGGSADILGIFDRPSVDVQLSDVRTLDLDPWFVCRTVDLPAAAKSAASDTLLIAATTFEVLELRPDGTGFTRIRLARSS